MRWHLRQLPVRASSAQDSLYRQLLQQTPAKTGAYVFRPDSSKPDDCRRLSVLPLDEDNALPDAEMLLLYRSSAFDSLNINQV